ncbi:MAG: SCO family protein, partial [Planctomycetaceae bacterium]
MLRFRFFVLALGIGLIWQGCSSQAPAPAPGKGAGESAEQEAQAGSPGAGRPDGKSTATRSPSGAPRVLFSLPEFELTDQAGAAYGTRQLLGQAWVGNFIFTRCKATCPVQTAKLADFQRQARRWPDWSRVRLVSISVDPEFDTPAVLADYARGYRADEESWKFLTGEREAIWKLSKEGFKLPVLDSPDDGGPITHSPRFVLVDPLGRVRGFYDSGDDREVRQLAIDLRYVLEETPDPDKQVTHVVLPRETLFAPWLEQRAEEQRAGADQLPVEHQFR